MNGDDISRPPMGFLRLISGCSEEEESLSIIIMGEYMMGGTTKEVTCTLGVSFLWSVNIFLCFLLPLTLIWFLLFRLTAEEVISVEADTTNRWQGICVTRTSPTPSESAATVKSLIKSFDLGCSGTPALHSGIRVVFFFH